MEGILESYCKFYLHRFIDISHANQIYMCFLKIKVIVVCIVVHIKPYVQQNKKRKNKKL